MPSRQAGVAYGEAWPLRGACLVSGPYRHRRTGRRRTSIHWQPRVADTPGGLTTRSRTVSIRPGNPYTPRTGDIVETTPVSLNDPMPSGAIIRLGVNLQLDLLTITEGRTDDTAQMLANAALRICGDVPNEALRHLIGAALESAAVNMWDHVQAQLGAAVVLLANVARSQLEGITG